MFAFSLQRILVSYSQIQTIKPQADSVFRSVGSVIIGSMRKCRPQAKPVRVSPGNRMEPRKNLDLKEARKDRYGGEPKVRLADAVEKELEQVLVFDDSSIVATVKKETTEENKESAAESPVSNGNLGALMEMSEVEYSSSGAWSIEDRRQSERAGAPPFD